MAHRQRKRGNLMIPATNPKAWEAVTGFTANIKAVVERLNKLAGYFPESKEHLIAVAARTEAECDATMKFLLAEALGGGMNDEPVTDYKRRHQ
jgi:hypothetical protein